MRQEVLGSAFKFVIENLLGIELLFPELRQRIASMQDTLWYDWADYVQATQQVAALLDHATVVTIGQDIMLTALPLLKAQGFTAPEALLGDWLAVFQANVRGLLPQQLPRTIEAQPGMAAIDYSTELPAALVEGYLRGAVLMFDGRVESYRAVATTVQGEQRLICHITWR